MKKVTSYKLRVKSSLGFTLIELLVVITLIGILAVAVLSAINPIEQVNKARDAGRRADANQLLSAIERYYAAVQDFPWNHSAFTDEPALGVNAEFLGRVDMLGVGVCGAELDGTESINDSGLGTGGCVARADGDYGLLITTEELKSQFAKRRSFRDGHVIEDELYIIKPANDPSISICFVPSSKATRNTANDSTKGLKFITLAADGDNYTPSASTIDPCATHTFAAGDGQPAWTDVAEYCFVCIPEE